MRIEVLKKKTDAQKQQGDVLENLAEEWLKILGYSVTRNLRLTACEIDLLCKNEVSCKEIYVECKAYNDENISANQLTSMLGKIELNNYTEGWFVTTGALGKDAKGFVDKWERRADRSKLSIYTPDRIIDALIKAKIITPAPTVPPFKLELKSNQEIGEWILVFCEQGKFWATTILQNGIPISFCLCSTKDGNLIQDDNLITQIKQTNFSFIAYPYWTEYLRKEEPHSELTCPIVEVEIGEKWSDYRPARPEHFVGRKKDIQDVFHFVSNVKKHKTDTRIFAIKGESGIGKSSFIAKIREDVKKHCKPKGVFIFAVDVRAANNFSYISAAFLQCLRFAQNAGYGKKIDLTLTNIQNPLESESIKAFLTECNRKNETIILILDQFEELYSKPALFGIFEAAKKLMFSVISANTCMIMGFAWKTDCSVPQDHPAYHMWHDLLDHRFEISLKQFSYTDAEQSLTMFESELTEKIRPDLKKYLLTNSQGFPWLLKKLCIHFAQQLSLGISQIEMENTALDIASLFEKDMNNLSSTEIECLKFIAKNAPADWIETLENFDDDLIQRLQNHRLIIKRGNKLNLYWDIFRDYVLSGNIPEIPFNYIPQATSIDGLLRVCMQLDRAQGKNIDTLANETEFKSTTVRNIIHDLIQFGIVKNDTTLDDIRLIDTITSLDEKDLLIKLRGIFKRHQLTIILAHEGKDSVFSQNDIVGFLKKIMPAAQHDHKTWSIYANKMRQWLIRLGYLSVKGESIFFDDKGDVDVNTISFSHRKPGGPLFIADASPAKSLEAFLYIVKNGEQPVFHMKSKGFRNACSILVRFGLVSLSHSYCYEQVFQEKNPEKITEKLFVAATNEDSIKIAIETLTANIKISPDEIGAIVRKKYNRKWKHSSIHRIGNGLVIWAKWIIQSKQLGKILSPPGRTSKESFDENQGLLF